MPGIWLDDDTYQQTAGQIWAQGATQQLHAGEQWAQQALQAAIQPVQQGMDALSRLQAMVPSVPQPTPAPVNAPTPEPAPAPAAPPPPEPTPTPQTAPIPVGQTPTAEPTPTPSVPTPSPEPLPSPPQPEPQPVQLPTPTPVSAGEDWAQQQIQNLLNPAQQVPQTSTTPTPTVPPTPTAPPNVPSASATPPASPPASTPGAPSGPQPSTSGDLVDQARQAATAAGIDPDIFTRQIQQESGFNPNARSGAGALGIAQFMPATAKGLGVDPMDPQAALTAAAQLDAQNLSKYGGDWSKALAAYNAGGGNVDKYGGVPPFSETQNYVNTILGGAKDLVQQGVQAGQNAIQQGQTAVNTAVQGVQSAVARTSQFAMGLSSGDAMAFCGPAAALAFAQTYGRNPTVDEAKQLAQQVGWNAGQGMAGPSSEVNLLKAMGIDAHMTSGVDWQTVGQDAAGGNPVIIDTPGHYYYVDGYNQDTGKFHVGTSGTDLRGGSEWMSADQINAMPQSGGSARAAIFADHPLSGPGQAATMAQSQPPARSPDLGSALNTLSGLGQLAPDFGTGFMLQQGQKLSAQLLSSPEVQSQAQNVAQAVLNVGGQAGQGASRTTQDVLGQGQSMLSPLGTDISQAPQSLGDMLSSNALLSQGIPTVQGALSAVPEVSAQGIAGAGGQILANVLGLPNAAGQLAQTPQAQQIGQAVQDFAYGGPIGAFNQNLAGLGQDIVGGVQALPSWSDLARANVPVLSGLAAQPSVLDSMQTIQDLTQKYAGTAGSAAIPMQGQEPLSLGVDPSVMTSEDRDAYDQARMNVAGLTLGGAPAGDWLKGAYRGGVISGLNTMADVASNATIGPVMAGASGYLRDLGALSSGRAAGRTLGAMSGVADWANNFLQGLSTTRAGSLRAQADPGVPTVIANLFEGVGALHGAFQNATSELLQSMEQGAAAGGRAGNNIFDPAWHNNFTSELANLPQDVLDRARAMGDRTAARGDLGALTSWLGQAASRGGPVTDALFPVYRMGMSLAARMVESSPLGLAGTLADVAKAAIGRGPYATGFTTPTMVGPTGQRIATSAVGPIGERLANNLIGTALSVWLANKALGGAITGSGPTDAAQRGVWLANGNQPDSFLAPDGQYHSWDKLAPQLRGPMMAAGAYADAVQAYNSALAKQGAAGPQAYNVQDPREAAAWQLVSEVGHQLMSATPMRTFANLYDSLTSGASAGSASLGGLSDMASSVLGGLVPESGLVRSLAQMTDPLQRQTLNATTIQQLPQAIAESVAENIPGLRENLPARQDVLGRQISNPLQGLGQVLPVRTAAGQPSTLLQTMQTAGVTPSAAPSTIPYGPFDEIRLTPQEQQTWQRVHGQLVQQTAANMVNSPDFRREPLKSQQMSLQLVDQIATHAANLQMLSVLGPSAGARAQTRPGALTAPVVGYSPDVMANQVMLAQQLQRNAQHQALMQSLLGESNPSGLQSLQAANAAAAGGI